MKHMSLSPLVSCPEGIDAADELITFGTEEFAPNRNQCAVLSRKGTVYYLTLHSEISICYLIFNEHFGRK